MKQDSQLASTPSLTHLYIRRAALYHLHSIVLAYEEESENEVSHMNWLRSEVYDACVSLISVANPESERGGQL